MTDHVTDKGMKHLAGLAQLEELDLFGTGVGDAGLEPDMKPQFGWLPQKVGGDVTEESIYPYSKAFISDILV